MTTAEEVDDVRDMLDLTELASLVTFELGGRRRDGADDAGTVTDDDDSSSEAPLRWSLQSMVSDTEREFSVRVRGVIDSAELADVVVDLAGIYVKKRPFIPAEPVVEEFVKRVAVMQLYPYLRQHVSDLSARLGAPVTLGVLHASQLTVSADDGE